MTPEEKAAAVVGGMSGWPYCWHCGTPQPPHAARRRRIYKWRSAPCLCNRCRTEKVTCHQCNENRQRGVMFWMKQLDHFLPTCIRCARRKRELGAYGQQKPGGVTFHKYPNGPFASIPGPVHRSLRRR